MLISAETEPGDGKSHCVRGPMLPALGGPSPDIIYPGMPGGMPCCYQQGTQMASGARRY